MKMMMVSNMKMMMVSNIKILIVLLLLVEMVTFSSFSFWLFFVCWKMILFVLKIIVIVFSFNNCWVKSSVHLNTSFSKIVCSKIDRLFNKIVCSPKNDRFLVKTSSFSKGLVQTNFRLIKTTISFTKSVGKFLWSLKNDCFIKFGRTINYCFSCTFSKSIVLWTIRSYILFYFIWTIPLFSNNFPRFKKCCLYTKTMSISSPWYIYLVCLVLSITGVKIMIQVKIMETKLELKWGKLHV